MRILKYLFFLFLLSLVALSVFVATQKGVFVMEESKIINSPKAAIYTYLNDTKNWKDWNSLAVEDSLIQISPTKNSIGQGSGLSWQGKEGEGNLKTLATKENDSIVQWINLNDNIATVCIRFKDTLGKTKVTMKAKGKMSFIFKVSTVFDGGAQKFFGTMFKKSLANLDRILDYEINTFSVKIDGLTNKPQIYYLSQTFNSEFSKVNKNAALVFTKINIFCKENNIATSGKPFIIYNTYNTQQKITNLSICIPIKDPIYIMEGSDIASKTLASFQAVKTTLTGHYSHLQNALDKTQDYFLLKNLRPDAAFSHIEIYTIGKKEIKNPSKWTTEIYYPVQQKVVIKPVVAAAPTNNEIVPKTNSEKEKPID